MRKRGFFILILMLIMLLMVSTVVAAGETIELKYGHDGSLTHQYQIAATYFKKLVEEKTNGRIEITIFPSGQLGHERELAEGIIMGTVDICTVAGALPSWVPSYEVWGIPFLIRDRQHAYHVLDGEIGEKWKEEFLAQGMKIMGYGDIGLRNLTNDVRPIRTPEDMEGLKFRVQESKIWLVTMKALNCTGVPIPFGELYTALQQGVVDGQENPLATIRSMKFYEVQKYCSITKHTFSPYCYLMNPKKFDSLSLEDQKIIEEAFAATEKYERDVQIKNYDENLQYLKDQGMQVTEDVDISAFIEATIDVAKAISDIVPTELVENIRNTK